MVQDKNINLTQRISIKSIFKEFIYKVCALLCIVIITLFIGFYSIILHSTHSDLCELVLEKSYSILAPLSRELALNNIQLAENIFSNYNSELKKIVGFKGLSLEIFTNNQKKPPIDSFNKYCAANLLESKISIPILFSNAYLGHIKGKLSYISWKEILGLIGLLGCTLTLLIILISKNLIHAVYSKILDPINALSQGHNLNKLSHQSALPLEVIEIDKNISLLNEKIRKSERDTQISKISSQVAHDIRSPLAALHMMTQHLQDLPEQNRILIRSAIQRIEDIANELANKKNKTPKTDNQDEVIRPTLLSSLIESIISEKNVQYRSTLGLKIEFEHNEHSYGLFAKIKPNEFKRVLSNLINNSIEAMDTKGFVRISLNSNNHIISVVVSDTGKGIPPDIIPKLMQKGASFGKENHNTSGSGLGLYHAKQAIESYDGNILIHSEINKGTRITLTLPFEQPPKWFLPELKISKTMHILILDDDDSIHNVWQVRLTSNAVDKNFIHHFTKPSEIIHWLNQETTTATYIFLCDYELLGEKQNGLQLIEELGIENHSVLVTSHFEDIKIRNHCKKINLKLLPKNLAGFIPIKIY